MAIFKALRIKSKINELVSDNGTNIHDVWVYGNLKDSSLKDIYPQSIIISKNKVIAEENNVDVDFYKSQKILKFIDSNGKYRVYPFNCKWQMDSKTESLGTVNRTITSILTGQSNEDSLGFKKTRTLSLVAHNVSIDVSEKLIDVYSSPYVYLYIGDGVSNDTEKDWLMVKVVTNQFTERSRKNKFQNFTVEIELPKTFTISKI